MSIKNESDLQSQKTTLFPSDPSAISAADLRTQHGDEIDSALNKIDAKTFRVDASPTGDASGFTLTFDYPTAYNGEIPFFFKAASNNAGGTSFTIQVNSLTALGVYDNSGNQISDDTLLSGRWYAAVWDTDADGGGTDGIVILFGIVDGNFDSITNSAGTEGPSFPKGIAYSDFSLFQIGTDVNITGASNPYITALSSNRIAYIDGGNEDLRTYEHQNGTWTQIGNDLNITSTSDPCICALSSSRVAFTDPGLKVIRTYDFDGTDWSQTGNSLAIGGNPGFMSVCALSSSRIAYIDSNENEDLRAYDFDGTDWSQVGNDLNIAGITAARLASMSSTRIAYIDSTNDDLRAYDFDGTNWSQVGSDLNISGITTAADLIAVTSKRVILVEPGNDLMQMYEFDGSTWSQIGTDFALASIGDPVITALSATKLAYIDGTDDDLRTYLLIPDYSNPPIAPFL